MTKLQTTGSYDEKSGDFSISISPNDNHLFTLDGLSIDDMKELKSLVDILLESYEDEKSREYNLREAEYYDRRAKLDLEYEWISNDSGTYTRKKITNPLLMEE